MDHPVEVICSCRAVLKNLSDRSIDRHLESKKHMKFVKQNPDVEIEFE